MKQFSIIVDFEFLSDPEYRSKGYGAIWCEANGVEFPEKFWPDFAVNILSGLNRTVVRLVRKEASSAWLEFMDGPFLVEFKAVDSTIHVKFIERSFEGNADKFSFSIAKEEFLASVLESNQAFSKSCMKYALKFLEWEDSYIAFQSCL
jgi:hypothetical protein